MTTSAKLLAPLLAIVGPAAVMTAGIMGAGSTVSLLTAGCYFRYSLLWAVLLSLPVIVVCQDTASRIGAVAEGKGMMRIIADQVGVPVMWLIVFPLLFTCITANIGQLGAMTAATIGLINSIAGPEVVDPIPSKQLEYTFYVGLALVCLALNATGGYKRTEKILSYLLFLVLICFFVVAVRAFFHLSEIEAMLAGLVPKIPEDVAVEGADPRKGFVSFAAIIGGGVAATAILSFPYFTTEGGYNLENVRGQFKKHVLLLGAVFGFYSCILLIAGGYALHPLEGSSGFATARELGQALSVLGPAGPILFSIGLLICAYTTLIVVAQLAAYFVLDCLGMDWRFRKGNYTFMGVFAAFVLGPAMIGPIWAMPPLLKVVISMVVNSLVAPFAIVLIVILINKRAFAGELKASPVRNVFLAYSVCVAGFTCYRAAVGFLEYLNAA